VDEVDANACRATGLFHQASARGRERIGVRTEAAAVRDEAPRHVRPLPSRRETS
jgi:hypothetical protein